jgi:hypothetical protein
MSFMTSSTSFPKLATTASALLLLLFLLAAATTAAAADAPPPSPLPLCSAGAPVSPGQLACSFNGVASAGQTLELAVDVSPEDAEYDLRFWLETLVAKDVEVLSFFLRFLGSLAFHRRCRSFSHTTETHNPKQNTAPCNPQTPAVPLYLPRASTKATKTTPTPPRANSGCCARAPAPGGGSCA